MNQTLSAGRRIQSIDVVRGLIMIIMTLDHCRDFFHLQGRQYAPTNMATTTVVLFFTRWITHFCAPTFVFLSGVSAYLAGLKRSKKELRAFLIKRGCWLALADMVIITFMFTLNPSYPAFVLEVLWAIGCSMIILGLLISLPLSWIALTGCVIFFGHNLLDYAHLPQDGVAGNALTLLLTAVGAVIPLGSGRMIIVLYAILPWTGVMLLGYVAGSLYKPGFDAQKRRKILLIAGCAATLLFVVLRFINQYGDPAPWSVQRNAAHSLLSFLNASKYPASLVYLCMTLGPVLILLSLVERVENRFTAFCKVYGNVPFFYFVVHLYFIRAINLVLILVSGMEIKTTGSPLVWQVVGFGYPLWRVYLFWLFVVTALYFPCKWYVNYKRLHRQWWLSYL